MTASDLSTLFVALAAVLVALFTWLDHRSSKPDVKAVREQVENTHTTNLRDDIDEVLAGLGEVKAEIGQLRGDLSIERRERLDLAERIQRS